MVASTAASWARKDDTATRVNHHENPFTPIDVLRPRLAPNQHIQPVRTKPHPGKRCLAANRRGARPTAPSMRGFTPPLTTFEPFLRTDRIPRASDRLHSNVPCWPSCSLVAFFTQSRAWSRSTSSPAKADRLADAQTVTKHRENEEMIARLPLRLQ